MIFVSPNVQLYNFRTSLKNSCQKIFLRLVKKDVYHKFSKYRCIFCWSYLSILTVWVQGLYFLSQRQNFNCGRKLIKSGPLSVFTSPKIYFFRHEMVGKKRTKKSWGPFFICLFFFPVFVCACVKWISLYSVRQFAYIYSVSGLWRYYWKAVTAVTGILLQI